MHIKPPHFFPSLLLIYSISSLVPVGGEKRHTMAHSLPAEEVEALTKALSGCGGLGVDEKSLVTVVGEWKHQPEKRGLFRRGCPTFFEADGSFEKLNDDYILRLKAEFARFKNLVLLWTMHPWERDARWAHHVLHKAHPFAILVEIACTRSSEELLGARRAYHALFHHSLEEDVAYHVKENHSNLLVGLVSAYRYEGSQVNEEMAKLEAKALGSAIKNAGTKKPVENDELIRILTTRSKPHLRLTFKYYKEIYGKPIEEDLNDELCLQETVQCLDSPPTYFSKLINKALKDATDKSTREALTRILVSRADVDMEEIKEEYHKLYEAQLEDIILGATHGNYKDALLSLVGRKE